MAEVEEEMEVDADVENQHFHSPRRKRPHHNADSQISFLEVAGRVAGVELENFMCHGRLKVDFDTANNNCFYIGGPNGSGKSALFASLNIGLGGRGNDNDRGPSVKTLHKEGKNKAKIRLILTNRGLGSHPDYGDFVVVERTITPSSSTYILKSITGSGRNQHERVVSKKKTDLDQLRIRYGIQLSNPIFWMSQDRSRHFLQQMKPDRLYKIFMHATELEHTKECYEKCEQIVTSIGAMCKSMKSDFEKQKREYQSMVEERRRLRTIQEMRNKQSEIGWMLLWCPLRDVLEEIQVIEKKREKFQKELRILQEGIEEGKSKKEDCATQASVLRNRLEKKSSGLRSSREKMSSLKATISNLKSDLGGQDSKQRALEASRVSLEKRRDRLVEQIASYEEESQCEKRKEEVALTKKKMEKINEKIVREARRIPGKIRELEQEIHRSEMTANNALMRFGENVPRILEVMNANAERFEHVPKGPIGMHIKVRDRRWAFAIEEATRRLLTSFVFNSKRDHQIFERLMKNNRISGALPNAIFAKNVLIDMATVEGTVLLKSDEDARRIMDGLCPEKCVRAYTATGGMAMGRNRRGEGFYRFYACRSSPRVVLLSEQATVADVE
ncbi:hypothetical protein OSTOST_14891 [Ostertagia ostertagi]